MEPVSSGRVIFVKLIPFRLIQRAFAFQAQKRLVAGFSMMDYCACVPFLELNSHLPSGGGDFAGCSGSAVEKEAESFEGECKLMKNELLCSKQNKYEVLDVVGEGVFGKVAKCRTSANKLVAVKILKNHPSLSYQTKMEVSIVRLLSSENAERFNIISSFECFTHRAHTCLVFELLEQNLLEFVRQNERSPFPLSWIRPILQQVLVALDKLKQMGIIHADMKPENIMLIDPSRFPCRVKLIDFGLALYVDDAEKFEGTELQTIYYRAPEILLGLPYSEAIDMWSLGCLIAELFIGWPLYPGRSEYDQICFISDTQGVPPLDMLNAAPKTHFFFEPVRDLFGSCWRLRPDCDEVTIRSEAERKFVFSCLDEIIFVNLPTDVDAADRACELLDREQFVDILKRMLAMRQNQRIRPVDALQHQFLRLTRMHERRKSETDTSFDATSVVTEGENSKQRTNGVFGICSRIGVALRSLKLCDELSLNWSNDLRAISEEYPNVESISFSRDDCAP